MGEKGSKGPGKSGLGADLMEALEGIFVRASAAACVVDAACQEEIMAAVQQWRKRLGGGDGADEAAKTSVGAAAKEEPAEQPPLAEAGEKPRADLNGQSASSPKYTTSPAEVRALRIAGQAGAQLLLTQIGEEAEQQALSCARLAEERRMRRFQEAQPLP